ncbi:MAG TPA: hypothetical protein VFE33_30120 [Thermoanaerobaculia bacterium]|nr:hypothetical protein [Thermoanaerobaculia bacterium]
MRLLLLLPLLPLAFTLTAHAAPPMPSPPATPEAKPATPAAAEKPVLLGAITREQVEAAVPDWVQAEVESAPDPAAVKALAAVAPGAEVTVYMGSWCGDSRREVSRLWRTLDDAGGSLPCTIAYVGVDHDKKEPAALVAGSGLRYVPTLIVKRDGHEVGRIVESAPHGVEQDLLALLNGTAHGLVTNRPDKAELLPEKQP